MFLVMLKTLLILCNFFIITKCTTFLDVCSNNGFVNKDLKNEVLPLSWNSKTIEQDWFYWGRLYSYCMQYNSTTSNTSKFDSNCSTTICKECMKACQTPFPFDVQNCTTFCNTPACLNSCTVYNDIRNNTAGSRNNSGKIPVLPAAVEIQSITQNNISFQWQPALNGKENPPSVYLIVLEVENTYSFLNVLGLTTSTNFVLTLPQICSTFINNYGRYQENTKYKLHVHPINFNGNGSAIQSSFTAVQLVQLADVSVGNPMYMKNAIGQPQIGLDVNWTLPSDHSKSSIISSVTIQGEVSPSRCTNPASKQAYATGLGNIILVEDVKPEFGSATLPSYNTVDDLLNSCTIQITTLTFVGGCLFGGKNISYFEYLGCTTVPNLDCPIATTTLAPDTYPINFTISIGLPVCIAYYEGLCSNNGRNYSCTLCATNMYNITVTWIKPKTSTPIIKYNIGWGTPNPVINSVIDIANRNDSIVDKNELSYVVTRTANGTQKFGVQVEALTSTPLFKSKRPMDPKSQKFVTLIGPTSLTPPPSPVTTTDRSGWSIGEVLAAVLVPLIALCTIFVIYKLFYRFRRRGHKDFEANDTFDMYIDPVKKTFPDDDWEIYPTSIQLDEKIGEGAFGTVFSAHISIEVILKTKYAKLKGGSSMLMKEKNPKVAVKLLKEGANEIEYQDFKEEITLMKSIGYHKNIVNLIGCSTVKQPMCLVVEIMGGGDLLHYLRKRRSKLCAVNSIATGAQSFMYTQNFQDSLQTSEENSKSELVPDGLLLSSSEDPNGLTPDDLVSFAWQIASGMEYLAANNLIHRDLAARNILVSDDRFVKISDFGLTRAVSSELIYVSNKNRKLPIKWMSVEAIFDQVFTTYSDVWAYGVVLFEIVTLGGSPYPSINNRELLRMLKSGYRMEKPENCAEPMYDIMLHCWNEDPLQRPTFTELREHLENIMSDGDRYFSFDINEQNTYYNVASFKSIESESEDSEIFEEEILNKPIQMKSIEELKQEHDAKEQAVEKDEKLRFHNALIQPDNDRYTQLNSLDKGELMNGVPINHNPYVNAAFDRFVLL